MSRFLVLIISIGNLISLDADTEKLILKCYEAQKLLYENRVTNPEEQDPTKQVSAPFFIGTDFQGDLALRTKLFVILNTYSGLDFTTETDLTKTYLKEIMTFLINAELGYGKNPFHNFCHGYFVALVTAEILIEIKEKKFLIDNKTMFTVILASFLHDFDFPKFSKTTDESHRKGYALFASNKYSSRTFAIKNKAVTTEVMNPLEFFHFLGSVQLLIENFTVELQNFVDFELFQDCILKTNMLIYFGMASYTDLKGGVILNSVDNSKSISFKLLSEVTHIADIYGSAFLNWELVIELFKRVILEFALEANAFPGNDLVKGPRGQIPSKNNNDWEEFFCKGQVTFVNGQLVSVLNHVKDYAPTFLSSSMQNIKTNYNLDGSFENTQDGQIFKYTNLKTNCPILGKMDIKNDTPSIVYSSWVKILI